MAPSTPPMRPARSSEPEPARTEKSCSCFVAIAYLIDCIMGPLSTKMNKRRKREKERGNGRVPLIPTMYL